MGLYHVICPTFGHKFSFEAKDKKQAEIKIREYNSYHSFTGRDKFYIVEKLYNVRADHPIGKRVDEIYLTEEQKNELVKEITPINYVIKVEESDVTNRIHNEYIN